MAENTPPTPDFTSDVASLGGDVREHSHAILRKTFEDGLRDFNEHMREDLEHLLEQYEAIYPPAMNAVLGYFTAAAKQRDLYFATASTVGFREMDGSLTEIKASRPILGLARGEDDDFFLAVYDQGRLKVFRDNRKERVELLDRHPLGDTQMWYSLSGHLKSMRGSLVWELSKFVWWDGKTSRTIVQGGFDTRRDRVRQSLDIANQRLAFAAGRTIHLVDLRPFLGGKVSMEKAVLLSRSQNHPAGGIALLEGRDGEPSAFVTEPDSRSIHFHTASPQVGLFLDASARSRVPLVSPLVDGSRFSIEFCYLLPEKLPTMAEIPLLGGPGYPSLYFDTRSNGPIFRWTFPDYPSLEPLEFRLGAHMPAPGNNWIHLAVTLEEGKFDFYRNGIHLIRHDAPAITPLPPRSRTMHLGNFGEDNFNAGPIGAFAELRTWDRGLASQEVLALQHNWVVADENGLPADLVMYHRFAGPGVMYPLQQGRELRPFMTTFTDLARQSDPFQITRPLGNGKPNKHPYQDGLLFRKTRNKLSNWIATDPGSGAVCWGERFPDGKWYLMQAPASGHLAPQKVQVIPEWDTALVHSPQFLPGDILANASQSEAAIIRHGFRAQAHSVGLVAARVRLAYQNLFAALDAAEAHRDADTTREEHRESHQNWMQAKNTHMRDTLDGKLEEHSNTGNALQEAIQMVREAESESVAIRMKAQLDRLRRRG